MIQTRMADVSLPEFIAWKRPLEHHSKENEKIASINERRCVRMTHTLFAELVPSTDRLKPSRHVPHEPVEQLKGTFQFVDVFIPDEHIGKVIRAMGWVMFPENDAYVDRVCALLPDGSHDKDAKRVLLLFQDFWLWLDTHPEFDKAQFVNMDSLPALRNDDALKAYQVLWYLPLRAAFMMMDSLKNWIASRAESIDRQTGGMLPQLKVLAMMWLVHKQQKQLKKLREEEK